MRETLTIGCRDTLGQYLENTWLPKIARETRPTTADTYARLVRKHILPHLRNALVQALDEEAVANWVDELKASGLSPKSVRNIHGVLSSALADAMAPSLRLVTRNVARGMENLPDVPKRRNRAWSAEQLQGLLAHVQRDRLAPLWRLMVVTGMRRGEAARVAVVRRRPRGQDRHRDEPAVNRRRPCR